MASKSERLLSAALVTLRAASRHRLYRVSLNKALFYADLVALRDQGDSITRNAYVALDQGPVIARYQQRLLAELEDRHWSTAHTGEPVRLTSEGEHGEAAELIGRTLTPGETQILSRASRWIASLTPSRASEYSHRNPGWQIAYDAGRGVERSPRPIDMEIAMQQVLEADPWLSEELDVDESLQSALVRALNGEGEDW